MDYQGVIEGVTLGTENTWKYNTCQACYFSWITWDPKGDVAIISKHCPACGKQRRPKGARYQTLNDLYESEMC